MQRWHSLIQTTLKKARVPLDNPSGALVCFFPKEIITALYTAQLCEHCGGFPYPFKLLPHASWPQVDHIKDICSSCWVSCVFSANTPPQVSNDTVLRPCLPGDLLQKSCSASTVTVVFTYVEINRAKQETSPCFGTSPIVRGVKAPSVKAEKERKWAKHTAANAPLTSCLSVSWMLAVAHTHNQRYWMEVRFSWQNALIVISRTTWHGVCCQFLFSFDQCNHISSRRPLSLFEEKIR